MSSIGLLNVSCKIKCFKRKLLLFDTTTYHLLYVFDYGSCSRCSVISAQEISQNDVHLHLSANTAVIKRNKKNIELGGKGAVI